MFKEVLLAGHNHIRLNVRVMTTAETGTPTAELIAMREVVSYSNKVRVTAEPGRPIAELRLCGTE